MYILRCRDGSLYTGITTDTVRRLAEHNKSVKGAAYTRSRRPVELVYSCDFDDRASASRREFAVKKMPKNKKEALIRSQQRTEKDKLT